MVRKGDPSPAAQDDSATTLPAGKAMLVSAIRQETGDLKTLLNQVFEERQMDFSEYREKFIQRRIAVRLRATGSDNYEEYLRHLKGNHEEMDALLDALTIHTTQFFRDPKVFEAIRTKILPQILTDEVIEGRKIVRIWSAGCSGGEEAMSILILIMEYLTEYLRHQLQMPRIHIVGTDIDRWSIEKANEGVYDETEFQSTPRVFRDKYFVDMGNRRFWRSKKWNSYFSFRRHDIVKDAPLRHVDLVLCRNTFIYFKRELQALCVEKFFNSLKREGFLVLGLTEWSAGETATGFLSFDRENRMYQKKGEE